MESTTVLGLGVNIEDIVRFEGLELDKDTTFQGKVFTKKELEYCFSKATPGSHLAARFSGKEAFVKTLDSITRDSTTLKDIEILNNKKGVPIVKIDDCDDLQVPVSLSHCKDKAIAFATLMGVDHDK